MPSYFTNLCAETNKNVSVTYVTKGKYTFNLQSKRKQVLDAFNSRKWDIIVVQGASRDMLRDSSTLKNKTLPAIDRFLSLFKIKQSNAKVYFVMTWPYKLGYAKNKKAFTATKMIQQVALGYKNLRSKNQLKIIPLGLLWNEVRLKRKDIQLYEEDKAHPSTFGSFLAAHSLYRVIFNDRKSNFKFSISKNWEKERFLQDHARRLILEDKYSYWFD